MEDERRADREGSEWKIVILRVAFVNAAGGLVRFGLSGVLVQREKGRKGDRDGGDGSNSFLVLRVKLLVNGNQGGRWAWDALTETRPCCTRQRDLVLSGSRCLHCSLLFCLLSGLTNYQVSTITKYGIINQLRTLQFVCSPQELEVQQNLSRQSAWVYCRELWWQTMVCFAALARAVSW